jgi:hypothetical protein
MQISPISMKFVSKYTMIIVNMKDKFSTIKDMVKSICNIIQGFGIYYYSNCDIFIGDWENDRFNGKGIYIFANGN